MNDSGIYYRRHLPHYQPEGETYQVVFRLAGSIPADVFREFKQERERGEKRIVRSKDESQKARMLQEYWWKHSEQFDKLLGNDTRGPFWLRKPEIAEIVDEAIRYRDKKEYNLIAHTVMPNHVHLVFGLSGEIPLGRDSVPSYEKLVRRVADPTPCEMTAHACYRVTEIIGSLKKYTALRANLILGRRGAFWHDESYDHVIRDDMELERTIEYVLLNPVKAGLCKSWRDWRWSHVKDGYVGD